MIKISQKAKFKTVKKPSSAVLIEKKSKFIASVCPVSCEEDALSFLKSVKSQYPDASHHVYAYIIDDNNIFRYSDDGEPGGTAGMPVLDTIRKEDIVDVIVVVTRYFGGTLLGTGGLVRAYTASAQKGINEAGIIKRALCNIIMICADYTLVGKIQYKISSDNLILNDTLYENDVKFFVCCLPENTNKLTEEITDLTNGRASCTVIEQKYVDLPD